MLSSNSRILVVIAARIIFVYSLPSHQKLLSFYGLFAYQYLPTDCNIVYYHVSYWTINVKNYINITYLIALLTWKITLISRILLHFIWEILKNMVFHIVNLFTIWSLLLSYFYILLTTGGLAGFIFYPSLMAYWSIDNINVIVAPTIEKSRQIAKTSRIYHEHFNVF